MTITKEEPEASVVTIDHDQVVDAIPVEASPLMETPAAPTTTPLDEYADQGKQSRL